MEHTRPRHLEFLSVEMSAKENVMAARRVRGFQTSAWHSATLVHNLVSGISPMSPSFLTVEQRLSPAYTFLWKRNRHWNFSTNNLEFSPRSL